MDTEKEHEKSKRVKVRVMREHCDPAVDGRNKHSTIIVHNIHDERPSVQRGTPRRTIDSDIDLRSPSRVMILVCPTPIPRHRAPLSLFVIFLSLRLLLLWLT